MSGLADDDDQSRGHPADTEHFRPTSETAEKRRYTPPATRRRGAEGAGRALVHVLTGPVSCGNTTCMLLIACWDAYPCSYFV